MAPKWYDHWTTWAGYGISYYFNNVRRYQTHHIWQFFLSGRQHSGAHALCMQHSSTAAALSTSFLLNNACNSPELNTLIIRFMELSSSVSMSRESKRLKNSSSDWMNSGNEFWQYSIWVKIRFPCFPVLPGSTEAQVISCGTVKSVFWLLTFSAVIANQRWDVFWDTVSFTMLGNLKHYYYFHFFFTVTPGWARSSER